MRGAPREFLTKERSDQISVLKISVLKTTPRGRGEAP